MTKYSEMMAALATEIMQEDEKNGLNDHLTSTEANKKRLEESAEQLGESYSREEVIKIMEWVDEWVIRHEDSLWELWAKGPRGRYTTSQLLDIYNTTKA